MSRFTLLLLLLLPVSAWGLSEQEVIDWREDIAFYEQQMLALHIDPFHSLSRTEFEAELDRIRQSLPTTSRMALLIDLMRLTSRIGDGHTSLPVGNQGLQRLPLTLQIFTDAVYVIGTTTEHQALLGARLNAINGVDVTRVMQQFADLVPYAENPYSTNVQIADYMMIADLLLGLGLVDGSQSVALRFELDGRVHEERLATLRDYEPEVTLSYFEPDLFAVEESVNDDLYFAASADKRTIYFRFRRYTTHERMEALVIALIGFIEQHASEHVIIDLRDNYGGDFFVGLKLAQGLVLADSVRWRSGVFTLIDNVTFSAAMSNASQFARILNARLVGQPSGARPNGYQDMGQFSLPNSGVLLTYSKRLYRFGNAEDEALYPDIEVPITIEDYRNNHDRQLRWVIDELARQP